MRNLIAAFLVAATLTGCNSEIDHAEVETRNGLIYKYGDTDPFTGRVLNQPIGVPGITLGACNSQVENGRYSGKSECLSGQQVVYEVEYRAGKKDGSETVFDVKTGHKKSVKNWSNGLQDGVEEQYLNGNLVSKKEYKAGNPDGEETRWSDDGKTILTKLTWREGKKHNGFTHIPEGKFNYLNGEMHGAQVKYSYIPGGLEQFISTEENYENGKLDGTQKNFVYIYQIKTAKQESEITYSNGIAISGWFRKFNETDGNLIQEIKLTQSPNSGKDGFHSNYPGKLVPDGLITPYNNQAQRPEGEEFWVNGVKVKYYFDPYGNGEFDYKILDTTTSYEKYRSVSRDEYSSFMASSDFSAERTSSQVATNTSTRLTTPEKCLDEWISAYREEIGDDAIIVNEQLSEWTEWCHEGKRP